MAEAISANKANPEKKKEALMVLIPRIRNRCSGSGTNEKLMQKINECFEQIYNDSGVIEDSDSRAFMQAGSAAIKLLPVNHLGDLKEKWNEEGDKLLTENKD